MAPRITRHNITKIRDVYYDVDSFEHPGGKLMIDLAVGREATILFESAHARQEVANAALEKVKTVPTSAVPADLLDDDSEEGVLTRFSPKNTPSTSELYTTIRKRVVREVFQRDGRCQGDRGARGVPTAHIVTVFALWFVTAALFMWCPSVVTAILVGTALQYIGTGLQHTANHGGLVQCGKLSKLLGYANDIGAGGSSLVWRYHHHVSHHMYCNDVELDQDVHSSYPLMRLDRSQPLQWFHRYQYLYAPLSFTFLGFSVHMQDYAMLCENRTFKVRFNGSTQKEIVEAMLLKFFHILWLYLVPHIIHGFSLHLLFCQWVAIGFGSAILAFQFIVSHNLDTCKPGFMLSEMAKKDWAAWQIETSASWGGSISAMGCGGLNLQIEHHLFPCAPHHLYPKMQPIVEEECKKAGVRYAKYSTLLDIGRDLIAFLVAMGTEATVDDAAVEGQKKKQ